MRRSTVLVLALLIVSSHAASCRQEPSTDHPFLTQPQVLSPKLIASDSDLREVSEIVRIAHEGGLQVGTAPWKVSLSRDWSRGGDWIWRVANTNKGGRSGRNVDIDDKSGAIVDRSHWLGPIQTSHSRSRDREDSQPCQAGSALCPVGAWSNSGLNLTRQAVTVLAVGCLNWAGKPARAKPAPACLAG